MTDDKGWTMTLMVHCDSALCYRGNCSAAIHDFPELGASRSPLLKAYEESCE